eukprot:scaffold15736_cov114-Isochrysis_galbana.AAC.4
MARPAFAWSGVAAELFPPKSRGDAKNIWYLALDPPKILFGGSWQASGPSCGGKLEKAIPAAMPEGRMMSLGSSAPVTTGSPSFWHRTAGGGGRSSLHLPTSSRTAVMTTCEVERAHRARRVAKRPEGHIPRRPTGSGIICGASAATAL